MLPCWEARAQLCHAGKRPRLVPGVSRASHTPYLAVVGFWRELEPQHIQVLSVPLVRVWGMNEWVFTPHSVCHAEKKSEEKSECLLPAAPSKPTAPLFLQGLSDLHVMDGSQVTMTVRVSGLSPRLSPLGMHENGHGCNTGIAPRQPAQLVHPSGHQPGAVSQRT